MSHGQKTCSPECKKQNRLAKRRAIDARRKKTDIQYRLGYNLRQRLRNALAGRTKTGRTMELLGCTHEFLVKWLEGQFTRHMTWANYGTHWNIDHKIPVTAFDLSTAKGQRQCCHYSNLQPMECTANLRKHDAVVPTQPELTIPLVGI